VPTERHLVAESTASKNARITSFIGTVTAVSIHSADPGTTGASELAGGSPAYARLTPSFSAASGGASNLASSLTFDIPAAGAPAYYGLWNGSTFLIGGALTVAESAYSAQGTYVLTSIPISA
jgi:hypothetical protein